MTDEAKEIADDLRTWRTANGLRAVDAAQALGVPLRTLEGIEQAKGFRYPDMLRLAMNGYKKGKANGKRI
jgi:transcriptional regulator with XRE-family HTH domain